MLATLSVTVLAIFCSVLLTFAVHWWYRIHFSDFGKKIAKIPGPWPVPLVGSALYVAKKFDTMLYLFQDEFVKKYGEIYKVVVGDHVYIGLSSPDYIEKVLTSQSQLTKGWDYAIIQEWLGEGLLISTGSKWRSRRRLLTPAFHFQILENFFDVFNVQSRVLVDQMEQSRLENPSHEIDVYPFITKCTLDIICETAMGVSVEAQTRNSDYVSAVYRISNLMMMRALKPWYMIDAIFYSTPLGWEYKRCLNTLHDFTRRVIQERKERLLQENIDVTEDDTKKKKAFLDLLLQSAQDGADITDADIRDEVDTFMFEGHDTNSMALTWFLYMMAKNPDKQDKVYAEINELFGDSDRPCTVKDIPYLKYLECCIKETLRLYPSVPSYERLTTEEMTFGDYVVPKGCSLTIFSYAVQRDPRYFPDPDKFLPERFLPENSVGRHPFSFVPFSAGPRNCIGQKFALLEEKVVLSTLLRTFRFELSPNTTVFPSQDITLRPKGGLLLKVLPRV